MSEPLEGFRVVELTLAVQGPAGLYLRDMGAEVLKVEPPIGDSSRHGKTRIMRRLKVHTVPICCRKPREAFSMY